MKTIVAFFIIGLVISYLIKRTYKYPKKDKEIQAREITAAESKVKQLNELEPSWNCPLRNDWKCTKTCVNWSPAYVQKGEGTEYFYGKYAIVIRPACTYFKRVL